MEKEFVTYEQALALKGLEFDEPCFGFYSNSYYSEDVILIQNAVKGGNHLVFKDVLAPLKQQAFRWFRENHNILHAVVAPIKVSTSNKEGYRYSWEIIDEQEDWIVDDSVLGYLTYEESENACIDKLIELCKQQ